METSLSVIISNDMLEDDVFGILSHDMSHPWAGERRRRSERVHFKVALPFPMRATCRPTLDVLYSTSLYSKVTCRACLKKLRRQETARVT